MVVDTPVYNLHALGFNTQVSGKDNVRNLYKFWAENQSVHLLRRKSASVGGGQLHRAHRACASAGLGRLHRSSKALGILPRGLSQDLLMEMLKLKGGQGRARLHVSLHQL